MSKETTHSPRPEIFELAAIEGLELDLHEAIALNGLVFGLKPSSEAEIAVRFDVMMTRAALDIPEAERSSSLMVERDDHLIELARFLTLARVTLVPVRV